MDPLGEKQAATTVTAGIENVAARIEMTAEKIVRTAQISLVGAVSAVGGEIDRVTAMLREESIAWRASAGEAPDRPAA